MLPIHTMTRVLYQSEPYSGLQAGSSLAPLIVHGTSQEPSPTLPNRRFKMEDQTGAAPPPPCPAILQSPKRTGGWCALRGAASGCEISYASNVYVGTKPRIIFLCSLLAGRGPFMLKYRSCNLLRMMAARAAFLRASFRPWTKPFTNHDKRMNAEFDRRPSGFSQPSSISLITRSS